MKTTIPIFLVAVLFLASCAADSSTLDVEQGEFTPELDAPSPEGIAYANRRGFYTRVGRWVSVEFEIEYTNLDPSQAEVDFAIQPPFGLSEEHVFHAFSGPLDTSRSSFGFQAPSFTTAQVVLDGAHAGPNIIVRGRSSTLGSEPVTLSLGDDREERIIVGAINYITD